MFNLSKALLGQIAATVKAFDECYVHGDGNIYVKDDKGKHEASDFRKNFSNPKQDASTYRVKYAKGDTLPTTVKELEDALLASRNKERQQEAIVKHASGIKTIKVEEEKQPEETDDQKLNKLIDEDEAAKK